MFLGPMRYQLVQHFNPFISCFSERVGVSVAGGMADFEWTQFTHPQGDLSAFCA